MPDAAARDASAAASKTTDAASYLELRRVNFFYGDKQAIYDVSLGVRKNNVLALIGPSGCGKSTLIKAINRISELMPGTRIEG